MTPKADWGKTIPGSDKPLRMYIIGHISLLYFFIEILFLQYY